MRLLERLATGLHDGKTTNEHATRESPSPTAVGEGLG
jgi:hypothetical protein